MPTTFELRGGPHDGLEVSVTRITPFIYMACSPKERAVYHDLHPTAYRYRYRLDDKRDGYTLDSPPLLRTTESK